jgi:FkbM family methyltransferase
MNFFRRIFKSVEDGSFVYKIANRLSRIQYVPGPEIDIDEYLAKHYPNGDAWRLLSPARRKIWIQFYPIFNQHEIKVIAYAGAHTGDIAVALNEVFPGREFYLFEPVPQTFEILLENTKQHKNMHCFNIAAGSKEEQQDIFVDEFSQASSLLSYEPIATREYPFLGRQHSVKVNIKPIDMMMKKHKATVDLILMDVQGYENEVLMGAEETIKSCNVIISELSLQALYRGSSTFDSIYQALAKKGFHLHYLINPMQGESHQILQMDGIFVRDSHE